MIFKRDTSDAPAPCTWDYWTHATPATGKLHLDNTIARCMCSNGHMSGLSRAVHAVVDGDGRLSPSFVCPVPGCTFHEWVLLDGWSWAWYDLHCAPDRPASTPSPAAEAGPEGEGGGRGEA